MRSSPPLLPWNRPSIPPTRSSALPASRWASTSNPKATGSATILEYGRCLEHLSYIVGSVGSTIWIADPMVPQICTLASRKFICFNYRVHGCCRPVVFFIRWRV